jgi:hypothetical protein
LFDFLEIPDARAIYTPIYQYRGIRRDNDERRWLRLDIWKRTAAVMDKVASQAPLRTAPLFLR